MRLNGRTPFQDEGSGWQDGAATPAAARQQPSRRAPAACRRCATRRSLPGCTRATVLLQPGCRASTLQENHQVALLEAVPQRCRSAAPTAPCCTCCHVPVSCPCHTRCAAALAPCSCLHTAAAAAAAAALVPCTQSSTSRQHCQRPSVAGRHQVQHPPAGCPRRRWRSCRYPTEPAGSRPGPCRRARYPSAGWQRASRNLQGQGQGRGAHGVHLWAAARARSSCARCANALLQRVLPSAAVARRTTCRRARRRLLVHGSRSFAPAPVGCWMLPARTVRVDAAQQVLVQLHLVEGLEGLVPVGEVLAGLATAHPAEPGRGGGAAGGGG